MPNGSCVSLNEICFLIAGLKHTNVNKTIGIDSHYYCMISNYTFLLYHI